MNDTTKQNRTATDQIDQPQETFLKIQYSIPTIKLQTPVKLQNKNVGQNLSLNQSFWLILFFLAGAKDLLELTFGLIPFIGPLISWLVSLLVGGLIIAFIFITGNHKKLKQTKTLIATLGQLIDAIPISNILPLSSFTILILYLTRNK